MVIFVEPNTYRQSYVEKDWIVRNIDDVEIVTAIDVLQAFEMPQDQFEKACLKAQQSFDSAAAPKNTANTATTTPPVTTPKRRRKTPLWRRVRPPTPARLSQNPSCRLDEETASIYADNCRREGAILQRGSQLEAAGLHYERACEIRAFNGLFCTADNATAHVEYAQNLSRRGLITKAEYHLRTALDIYRLLEMRNHRVYADALLYTAVIVDQQARSFEAESFYRASIAVYENIHCFNDPNFRVAVDSLIQNLARQGRVDEANDLMTQHTSLICDQTRIEVQIEIPPFNLDELS